MISVEEARDCILQRVASASPSTIPSDRALGLVLARDVASDVDSPPHDKSMVDGYALRAKDLSAGRSEFQLIEEVVAGQVPRQPVHSGGATRIMTGAPVPEQADAVVMVEQTECAVAGQDTIVKVGQLDARPGQHIMRRGTSFRRGEVVLSAGARIRAIEMGLLCEVGATEVEVYTPPSVAVLSTGNELVAPSAIPAAGQIRNSNGPMLAALISSAGGQPVDLGIGLDEPAALRERIRAGLEQDVLVLSGGVSAGVLDLVPALLQEEGVEQLFHKVRVRPGKPLWFGATDDRERPRLVFGLPGNPVSSLVCFEVFVRPALRRLAGLAPLPQRTATLTAEYQHRGERDTFYPVECRADGGGFAATPVPWQGSADLRSMSRADALLRFPAGDRTYQAGELLELVML